MAKNSIRDFSATAASNTDIQSVDIDENCAASGINNAIRELMADLADVNAGTVALNSPSVTTTLTLNNTSTPASTPSQSGFLFVESGALKYKGSSGTVTTLASA